MRRARTGWAVVDARGNIWMPVHARRSAAIAHHLHWHLPCNEAVVSTLALSGPLDSLQRAAWAECRRRGERVVKADITWNVDP